MQGGAPFPWHHRSGSVDELVFCPSEVWQLAISCQSLLYSQLLCRARDPSQDPPGSVADSSLLRDLTPCGGHTPAMPWSSTYQLQRRNACRLLLPFNRVQHSS